MGEYGVPLAATLACVVAVAILLWSERRGDERVRRAAKVSAAAAFLIVGLAGGALDTGYGRWILVGLAFGAAGDVALLGHGKRALAAGMLLFAAGHVSYLAAVATRVPPADWLGFWTFAPPLLAIVVLFFLRRHLGAFLVPVALYMALFCTVVTAAWAPLLLGGRLRSAPLLAAGATLFFFSDVAVARQRFVVKSFWNKAWGLPFYFGGQLLLAWSAITL